MTFLFLKVCKYLHSTIHFSDCISPSCNLYWVYLWVCYDLEHSEAAGSPVPMVPVRPTLNCSKHGGAEHCFLTCQSQVNISNSECTLHALGSLYTLSREFGSCCTQPFLASLAPVCCVCRRWRFLHRDLWPAAAWLVWRRTAGWQWASLLRQVHACTTFTPHLCAIAFTWKQEDEIVDFKWML